LSITPNDSYYYRSTLPKIDHNFGEAANDLARHKATLLDEAMLLYDSGNYTQAIKLYNAILTINPKDGDALHNMGDALVRLGNYTGALQYFKKALDVNGSDTVALEVDTDNLIKFSCRLVNIGDSLDHMHDLII
jgi:tetratricopeptide (TPR) repeat protein